METAAFGVGCFIKRKSGVFLLDALDGQSLGRLHQQHAHAVEENGTHDEGDEELGQVGGQSGGVDAGHSQVAKPTLFSTLGA